MRVLHDWFGCMNVPRSFWRGMREAGVEVKAVNPPASGPPLGAIRRDHRKLLVRGRRVRLHGRGVHRRRLDGPLPRHGFALPRHRRQREGTGRGRHQPRLHQPVGRDGGGVARGGAP